MCFSCFALKFNTLSLRLLYEAEFIFDHVFCAESVRFPAAKILQLMSLTSDPSDVTKGADASSRLMTPNLVFIQTAANSFLFPTCVLKAQQCFFAGRCKQRAKYAVILVSLTFFSIIKRLLDV